MPTIKEKVIVVFQNRIGEEFGREEIIDLLVNQYPGTNRGSVIPSDYSYNIVNAGICFNFHMFESLGEREGRYLCLGRHESYTGAIYWHPVGENRRQVGEWEAGKFRLWANAPPRLLKRYGADKWIDPRQIGK
jgi:hypothetical protein